MSDTLSENELEIRLLELSESLGYQKDTIAWVMGCVVEISDRYTIDPENPKHITAHEVCKGLIQDLCTLYNDPTEKVLLDLKIESSKDIGKIMYGLIEKELISQSENDAESDFSNIFLTANIDAFIDQEKLKGKGLKPATYTIR